MANNKKNAPKSAKVENKKSDFVNNLGVFKTMCDVVFGKAETQENAMSILNAFRDSWNKNNERLNLPAMSVKDTEKAKGKTAEKTAPKTEDKKTEAKAEAPKTRGRKAKEEPKEEPKVEAKKTEDKKTAPKEEPKKIEQIMKVTAKVAKDYGISLHKFPKSDGTVSDVSYALIASKEFRALCNKLGLGWRKTVKVGDTVGAWFVSSKNLKAVEKTFKVKVG